MDRIYLRTLCGRPQHSLAALVIPNFLSLLGLRWLHLAESIKYQSHENRDAQAPSGALMYKLNFEDSDPGLTLDDFTLCGTWFW